MSKVDRITLCYEDMDRIIVDKVEFLKKYDLFNVKSFEVQLVGLTYTQFCQALAVASEQRIVETGTVNAVTTDESGKQQA